MSTDGGSSWSSVGALQSGGSVSMLTLTAEDAMSGNLYRCRIADSNYVYAYTEATTLTVMEPLPYTLSSLILRDQSTNAVLSAIPADGFLAELTVTNVSAASGATFVLVTYDAEGMMIDMSYFIAAPTVGDTMTMGALVKNNGSAARVRAMALTSLGEMIPLAQAIKYPAK